MVLHLYHGLSLLRYILVNYCSVNLVKHSQLHKLYINTNLSSLWFLFQRTNENSQISHFCNLSFPLTNSILFSFHRLSQDFHTISDIPFLLEHLFRQQASLTKQKVRLEQLEKFSKHLESDQLRDHTFYKQRIDDRSNALEDVKRERHSHQKTLDRTHVQLKDDMRSLGELLVHAETLRTFSLPLDLHNHLVTQLSEYKDQLENASQHLSQEHSDRLTAFNAVDQLDRINRETIEVERQMMLHSFQLREMSAFHQELQHQYPARKFQKKPKADLQYVYEARRKLQCTQPAYTPTQIERFKFKLELCRSNLEMLTSYRAPIVCNMTLPCINKIAAIKLRLITQMMANVPSYLTNSGNLRLNFQYDRTKYSDDDSKTVSKTTILFFSISLSFISLLSNGK